MIGTENVDQRIETAPHLVVVIGDVGGEIGPAPIGLFHRAVHIIAMGGRAEQGLDAGFPIIGLFALGRFQNAFVDQALAAQCVNRGLDLARAIKCLFR